MRNFFKGISFTQIGAGALAAVTSFLLSAKIGVAGSVIGVAVGSVVAAVASQIYQNVFKASSEKIQNVIPFNGSDADQDHSQGGGQSAESDSTMVIGAERPDGAHADGEVSQTATLPVQEGGQPRVVSSQGSHADASHAGIVHAGTVHAGEVGTAKEPGHGAALSEADQHRRRKVAIIVAVVSALLAVGLTSAIIMLATKGKGTDDYVRNIVSNSKVVRTPAPSTSGGTGQTPSPSPSSSGAATNGGESGQHGSQGTSTPTAGATPSGSSTGGSGSSSGPASPGSGSSSGTGTPSSGSGSSTGSPSSGTSGGSNNESNGGTTSGSTTVNGTSGGSSNSNGKANTSSSKESGSATDTSAKGLGSTASGADSSTQPQEILSNSAK
ncbi:MAG: hypothetical protein LKI34_03540 [Bifidobacterium tibiigranuli]|uniref:hypothetical protein n=1 Tax=Bifidobacterium tibiigranuli TaxID=2172043 RepID=UPI0026E93B94|nr:hypothetical protein [Bifidobacterium tibiigranuli]MCI1673275.1 hypothetical protein [Bifidobacterium tibiigranuli]MCI1712614.1 hypothetical protein [Bifidobacterium tibiigranuli]MCI1833787.1 hypothetical protein [Bifidobacterium tibiigranuli]